MQDKLLLELYRSRFLITAIVISWVGFWGNSLFSPMGTLFFLINIVSNIILFRRLYLSNTEL